MDSFISIGMFEKPAETSAFLILQSGKTKTGVGPESETKSRLDVLPESDGVRYP